MVALIFTLIGAYIFLFFFWRKLREDYTLYQIFSVAFYALIGGGVAGILADNFAPLWFFWLSLSGAILGFSIGIYKFNMRPFEILEAGVPGGLVIISFYFFYNYLFSRNIATLTATIAILAMLVLFFLLNKHYKKFAWYKSGRVGFSGIAISGIFFLTRAVVALINPSMLSFVGKVEVVISGVLSFVCFLMLFNLAQVKT